MILGGFYFEYLRGRLNMIVKPDVGKSPAFTSPYWAKKSEFNIANVPDRQQLSEKSSELC
jgi:hypothetical protein